MEKLKLEFTKAGKLQDALAVEGEIKATSGKEAVAPETTLGSSKEKLQAWLPGKSLVGEWSYGPVTIQIDATEARTYDSHTADTPAKHHFQWKVTGVREVTLQKTDKANERPIVLRFSQDYSTVTCIDRPELK